MPDPQTTPLLDLRRRLDQLFEELIYRPWGIPAPNEWRPHVDQYETREAYVVKIDLPGVPPEDVEIRVTGGELVVTGSRPADGPEWAPVGHRECPAGRFRRSIVLAHTVSTEQIRAECRHGTYLIWLPKKTRTGSGEWGSAAAEPRSGPLIRITNR